MVRAALSPTATLLLLLVASLLAISLMLHCCCALVLMSDNITMAAACWSWCMSISNSSIEVQLARASPLDMLVLVDEVVSASWAAHQLRPAARGDVACLVFGVVQLARHVEDGLLEFFPLVRGSSAPAPSCWRERRRQTSGAAAAMLLAEWRACGSW